MEKVQQLTLEETIDEIKYLIETSDGDTGRLAHILDTIKNHKNLYQSDKAFLERKLDAQFSLEKEEPQNENPILSKIQKLIESGQGDTMRLKHIHDTISKGKHLYQSDQKYLEEKLNSYNPEKKLEPENQIIFENEPPAKKEENIKEPNTEIIKSKGVMPKGWKPTDNDFSEELTKIKDKIKTEEEKIEEEKQISSEISRHQQKLTGLVQKRHQHEQELSKEQTLLESKIKEEKEKIVIQTKLAEQISSQRIELENVGSERDKIVKKIEEEKVIIEKDLFSRKKQLSQAQIEEKKLEKQIQEEQTKLAEMAESQKLRLQEQSKLAKEIRQKQNDLEEIKQEYETIRDQTDQEKSKLEEELKLQKIIQTQEKELLKTQNARQKLTNQIEREKKTLANRAKEESVKLKRQKEISKELKKEACELVKWVPREMILEMDKDNIKFPI
ncbi:MAG: hypothetical protein P8X83_07910, partial [Nitrosopumilaceae archaeon]